jgi:predicted nucleic acid-binding protein
VSCESPVVVDASALIEALAVEDPGGPIGERLGKEAVLHAPSHISAEFTNGIRRLELHGKVSTQRAEEALNDFLALPIHQHRFEPLAHRVWALRASLTAYDAAYVAVAENLGHLFCTTDRRLASVPGLRCQIVVV